MPGRSASCGGAWNTRLSPRRRLETKCARNAPPVTPIILLVVLAAVVIGLGTAFGGPLVGAILAIVAVVGAIVWFFALGASKTTGGEVVRETHEQEFLGPGGPDDPTS